MIVKPKPAKLSIPDSWRAIEKHNEGVVKRNREAADYSMKHKTGSYSTEDQTSIIDVDVKNATEKDWNILQADVPLNQFLDWAQDGDPVRFTINLYEVAQVENLYALKHSGKLSKRCVIEFPEVHTVKEHTRKIGGKKITVKAHGRGRVKAS